MLRVFVGRKFGSIYNLEFKPRLLKQPYVDQMHFYRVHVHECYVFEFKAQTVCSLDVKVLVQWPCNCLYNEGIVIKFPAVTDFSCFQNIQTGPGAHPTF